MPRSSQTGSFSRRLWPLLFLAWAASLAGCHKPGATTLLPAFDATALLGEPLDADGAISASIESFQTGIRAFAVIEAQAVSSLLEMSFTESEDGMWRTEITEQRAAVMRFEDGRLVLVETTDFPNEAVTTFDPPLLLIDKGMSAESEAASEHQVVVRSLKDASKIVDRGSAEQSLVRETDQNLLLPDGTNRRAAKLTRTLNISLGRAKVHEVISSWYVSDLGLAAEQSREEVKVFGPIGWTKERLLVRVP